MELQNVLYLLLWAGIFFVMMRFGCGAHVMGYGHQHDGKRPDEGRRPGSSATLLAPEKDVDPVCGMTIQTVTAKSAMHEGHVYYFCSQSCREKFEAAPTSYVKPASAPSQEGEKHHGCC